MPPTAQQFKLVELEDDDIRSLWTIIEATEHESLLNATEPVDTVLLRTAANWIRNEGLTKENRRRYEWVIQGLYKLGASKGSVSLRKRFIQLFGEEGITIEDPETEASQTRPVEDEEHNETLVEIAEHVRSLSAGPRVVADVDRQWDPTQRSTSSRPRSILNGEYAAASARRMSSGDEAGPYARTIRKSSRSHVLELPVRSRMSEPDLAQLQRQPHDSRISSDRERRAMRRSTSERRRIAQSENDSSSSDDDAHSIEREGTVERSRTPKELRRLLNAREPHMVTRLSRRYLRKWVQSHAQAEKRKKDAICKDQFSIKRSVIDIFKAKLSQKQYAAQIEEVELATQRFFRHLEDNCEKARKEHLLEKGFTHWQNSAQEAIIRTATARRHILRFRTFGAWREATATDIINVGRFTLRRFFNRWQRRKQELEIDEEVAVVFRKQNLVRSCWQSLVREAWGRQALHQFRSRQAAEIFRRWRGYAMEVRRNLDLYERMRYQRIAQRVITKWRTCTQLRRQQDAEAVAFHERRVSGNVVGKWKTASVLSVREKQFSHWQTTHSLRRNIQTWSRETRDRQTARAFRGRKLQQSSCLQLRLALRAGSLRATIDERILGEAMYRWLLASQEARSDRQCRRRTLQRCFTTWADKAFDQRAVLEETTEFYTASQQRVQMLTALRRWFSVLQQHAQSEQSAQAFRVSQLTQFAFAKWQAKHQTIQHNEQQAHAAHFYILSSTTLKTWKAASHEHQRLRRREAYATIRRQVKMNLARSMLHRMRDAVAHRRALDQIAASTAEDRHMARTIRTWTRWRDLTALYVSWSEQCGVTYQQRIVRTSFARLTNHLGEVSQLNSAAASFKQLATERSAASVFRRLDRRIFQIQGQEQWATSLRQRLFDKHVKGMLRYWAERTSQSRLRETDAPIYEEDSPPDGLDPEYTQADMSDLIDLASTVKKPAAQYNYPPGLTDQQHRTATAIATPLPGYLRTPSKRSTALAKARQRLLFPPGGNTATPARPPATAPPGFRDVGTRGGGGVTSFERKLMAQGYGRPAYASSPSVVRRRSPERGARAGTTTASATVAATGSSGTAVESTPFGIVGKGARPVEKGFEDVVQPDFRKWGNG